MKDSNKKSVRPQLRIFLWMLPILLSTLACGYVTQLILPGTPTPFPTLTITPTATLQPTATVTPPVDFQAACPSLLSEIVSAATNNSPVLLTPRRGDEDEDEVQYLVSYAISDDQLGERNDVAIPDNFSQQLDERAAHEAIWNFFAALVPASERDLLVEFSVMTDGRSRILGGVRRTNEDPDQWELRIDVLDARNRHDLTYTLMHEFGHLLTLKSSQVTFDPSIREDPENQEAYDSAAAACPNYFSGDGCSLPDSYINEFFLRYWSSFFEEWQEIDKAKDGPAYRDMLHDFYESHADQFLTEYSVTSPEEDMAEAWAFFILSPKPEPTSIANEKVLFFYEFPELLYLRQEILTRLCAEFPQ